MNKLLWPGWTEVPAKTRATKAREQVALSRRISPQSSSLQQKLSHPVKSVHDMHRFDKFVYKGKIREGTKLAFNMGEKILLSYVNENTSLCFRCMVYLSRTSKTAQNVSIFL